jgi:isochorismate synthase EntC
MAETMQNAYDVVIKKGDIDREINHAAIVRLVQASNEFGSQIWQTMGDLATDIQQKQEANQEVAERLTTGVQIINDVLEGFATYQANWNKNVENWASEKEDNDRKRDKRIRALAKAEERQQRWQLEYEAAREQEKKELIDKVIQTVTNRLAKQQPIDTQSVMEAIHEQTRQSSPSSSVSNAALGNAPPSSRNNTERGGSAGNGGRGNGPPG